MSTNGSRSVTVHQRDAWLPFAVAGLGLLLLLGLIQVPDVDGALSLAIVCVPLGIVPAAFVGVQYRLLAPRSPPEISTRRRNAFTAVVTRWWRAVRTSITPMCCGLGTRLECCPTG